MPWFITNVTLGQKTLYLEKGVYISGLERIGKLKFSMSTHLTE